ncbi:MAG: alpha-L-arabinofuranosidase C-terminal domain-containing protein [Solirubrobacteraceae bacterium]|jgi:alpha-L-arabinofuranosidase
MIVSARHPRPSSRRQRPPRGRESRIGTARRLLIALLAGAAALGAGMTATAFAASLTVNAARVGATINPTQFGAFMEEINHAGDGGLYGELIRNRDLKEDPNAPVYWSGYNTNGSQESISLDTTQPLNNANPASLKLSIGAITSGGSVGVSNNGYWGIPVKPSTTYRVSFFAKSSRPASGSLTVMLRSLLPGPTWATATVGSVTNHWARFTATLTTPGNIPATLNNTFTIATKDPADAGSTLWFTIVSLFPPTYDNAANGFRIDLMQKLAALHPGYFRVPGGNYLEGQTLATSFQWQNTIGPIEDRPGHDDSAWGYWSDDGMGLLEWLELAEQLHAPILLSLDAGYALDGEVVPQAQLAPYVQSALNEIQFAIGGPNTPWGAQRVADGHPAPFALTMAEIGNEDFFDNTGSYNAYRYPMFYDAIRAADPQLKIVATTPVTSRPMEILDEHYYSNTPAFFAGEAHLFDHVSRSGPKILVGEYAADAGSGPTGTLADALGEAAFLTGIERNADVVIGASYAPLLVNVNAPNWPVNMIGYNGLTSFGSPSYWVAKMFADGHGHQVVATALRGASRNVTDVASHARGHTYVVVVNNGAGAVKTTVRLAGLRGGARSATATVLTGAPAAMNSIADPTAVLPKSTGLRVHGLTFSYTFLAHSVTVLNLRTA